MEAVLFDFGGVFTQSPFGAARRGGTERGIPVDVALELCFGSYHEDTDHPWHRLERGEVSLEQARGELVALAEERGIEVDPLTLLSGLAGEDPQRAEIIERAKAIRVAGFRTVLVTNNVAEFGEAWRSLVPVDELFEVVIDSSRTGCRKPGSRIFELALDAAGSRAERSVFVDDHPANVAAAEELGMHGIVVGDDRLEAFDRLESVLGLYP
jgi:putative hydrolase of the HAD superfamily